MLDLVFFQLVSLLTAITLVLLLRPRPLALVPLSVALLHILIWQVWVLASGLAGAINLPAWRLIAFVLLVAVGLVWLVQLRPLRHELTRWRERRTRTLEVLGRGRSILLVGVPAIMAMWLFLNAMLVGPYIGDVVGYHLVPATDWVAEGALVHNGWTDERAWWPQGEGLIWAAWMLPTGSIRASSAAQVHWLFLIIAAVWALVRQWGGGSRQAATAVTLTALVPIIWGQLSATLNDIIVTGLILTALAALAGRRPRAVHLSLALTAGIMGLGIKPTMLMSGPTLAILFLFRWLQCLRRRPVRHWIKRVSGMVSDSEGHHGTALAWALILLIATLTSGYWFYRNAKVWGHPMYPAVISTGGQPLDFQGSMSHTHPITLDKVLSNLKDMAVDKHWDRTPLRDGQGTNSAGFGMTAAVLGLPAMLGLLLTHRRSRPVLLGVLLMVPITAMGADDDAWKGRFFSYLPLVWIACIAMITPRLPRGLFRQLWGGMLITTAIWSLFVAVRSTIPARIHWLERGLKPATFEELVRLPQSDLFRSLQQVPDDVPLVVLATDARGLGPFAMLHGPTLQRKLIYHRGVPDADTLERWKRDRQQYVALIVEDHKMEPYHQHLIAHGLKLVADGVYRIP